MDTVIAPVEMLDRGVLRVGVQAELRKPVAHRLHRGDMIDVRVGDEEVDGIQLLLFDQFEDRLGVPARVEDGGLARPFVPRHVGVDREIFPRREAAQFPPLRNVHRLGQPAARITFQLGGAQPEQGGQPVEVQRLRGLPGILERGELLETQPGGVGRGFGGRLLMKPFFGDDVADVIFQLHGRAA